MSSAVERFDEAARRRVGAYGRTVVRERELLRHPVYTRLMHWSVAIFFVPALLSGFAIYSPWLFYWLTPLFGGGPMTRLLHMWFGLGFVAFFVFQFLNWLVPMTWRRHDRDWLRQVRAYVCNERKLEPEYVGFFNAGQKLYFWAIAGSAVLFLVSGIPMWFPQTFGRLATAIGYVVHDIAALVMLVGFIVHVYQSTASQPGTFHSMTRGTVTDKWAWTHHPAWYRETTGRDPRVDYERAREQRADPERRGE
jgi:formate dehydrogenase, gamma subunit